jgi:hypothetical protein
VVFLSFTLIIVGEGVSYIFFKKMSLGKKKIAAQIQGNRKLAHGP